MLGCGWCFKEVFWEWEWVWLVNLCLIQLDSLQVSEVKKEKHARGSLLADMQIRKPKHSENNPGDLKIHGVRAAYICSAIKQ